MHECNRVNSVYDLTERKREREKERKRERETERKREREEKERKRERETERKRERECQVRLYFWAQLEPTRVRWNCEC